jgi:hypothetical protein
MTTFADDVPVFGGSLRAKKIAASTTARKPSAMNQRGEGIDTPR